MPWHVAKSSKCPASKPFAVINTDTGDTGNRCHATKASAVQQMKAMYANTPPSEHKAGEVAVFTRGDGSEIAMPVYDA